MQNPAVKLLLVLGGLIAAFAAYWFVVKEDEEDDEQVPNGTGGGGTGGGGTGGGGTGGGETGGDETGGGGTGGGGKRWTDKGIGVIHSTHTKSETTYDLESAAKTALETLVLTDPQWTYVGAELKVGFWKWHLYKNDATLVIQNSPTLGFSANMTRRVWEFS